MSNSDAQKNMDKPIWVIHKHDATSLHYDVRIQVDGVLASWAVPKGPSTDPRDRRLAMQVDDHDLEYAEFEGVIPEGNYGAGAVLIWDRGTYRNLKEGPEAESVAQQIKNGHVTIWLEGNKISGGYSLVRIATGEDERWLLVKMDDEEADARRNPVSTEPNSVKTERSLDEIREDAERDDDS